MNERLNSQIRYMSKCYRETSYGFYIVILDSLYYIKDGIHYTDVELAEKVRGKTGMCQ